MISNLKRAIIQNLNYWITYERYLINIELLICIIFVHRHHQTANQRIASLEQRLRSQIKTMVLHTSCPLLLIGSLLSIHIRMLLSGGSVASRGKAGTIPQNVMISWKPMVDAITTIYFIKPYRDVLTRACTDLVTRLKKKSTSAVAPASGANVYSIRVNPSIHMHRIKRNTYAKFYIHQRQ